MLTWMTHCRTILYAGAAVCSPAAQQWSLRMHDSQSAALSPPAAEAAIDAAGRAPAPGAADSPERAALRARIADHAQRPAREGEILAMEMAVSAGRPLRQKEFLAAGIHRQHVADLATMGMLVRISRGCYRLPDAPSADGWEYVGGAALRWPEAVVCGPTAAAYHGLIKDPPGVVWLAVARGHGRPRGSVAGRALCVREWLPQRRTVGVERVTVDGTPVNMVTAAQAVAELYELAPRFGASVAREAFAAYLKSGRPLDDLARAAESCGSRELDTALESLSAPAAACWE